MTYLRWKVEDMVNKEGIFSNGIKDFLASFLTK